MAEHTNDELYGLMVRHERELREEQAKAMERALTLQAKEYDRRLEELNHAHARALEDKSHFLQKAIYDQTQRELAEWKDRINGELAAHRLAVAGTQRTLALVVLIAMPIVAAAMNLVLGVVLK